MLVSREFIIVENICLVCLLDLTADFEVKTNARLTPIFKLREKTETGIQTATLTPIFLRKFPDVYSLIYNFSECY